MDIYKPKEKGSLIAIEAEEPILVMFGAMREALKIHEGSEMTQIQTLNYVEFLRQQGLEFISVNELNRYEEDFFEELAQSYRLMMYN